MIKLEALLGLVTLALWIYALVQVITTDESRMQHLPKVVWVLVVLFFPLAGSIAWLVAGRRRDTPPVGAGRDFPEYDRPGRMAAADPEADAEFLRRMRERAEEQRQRYQQQKRTETDPES